MSLRVWLPLDGTLENKGVSDITVTNHGATISTDGKIGSCYTFSSSAWQRIVFPYNLSNATEFSICLWHKPTTTSISGALFTFSRTSGNYWQFAISQNNLTIRDSSTGVTGTRKNYSLGTFVANQWVHLTLTYNAGTVKIYKDGSLFSTNTTGGTSMCSYDGTTAGIGETLTNNSSYYIGGSINDFRIYDHCLSAAEVKEISQGLVLHYKLDSLNNNLFKLTPQGYHPTDYCGYNLGLETNLVGGQQYTVQFWDVTISHSGKTNTQLNLQLYWGGGNNWLVTLANSNFTNGHADYLKATFTAPASPTNATEAQNAWINVYNSPSYASGTLNMHIGAWKIEKGNIGTQWSANDNMIIDSSGHNHNGTITGALTLTSDTPRYSVAITSNTAASILNSNSTIPTSLTTNNKYTMCAWLKTNATNNRWIYSIGNGTGGYRGLWLTTNGSKPHFAYSGSGAFTATTTVNNNVWHHIAFTVDGATSKCFVDGVQCGSSTSTKTDVAGNNNITITFNGSDSISDFRVYCTTLSADDILTLYHTGAKIDNQQNFHTYELVENQSAIKITKHGQTKLNELNEATTTKFYKTNKNIDTKQIIEF